MKITKELEKDLDNIADYLEQHAFGGTSILVTGASGMIGSLIIRAIVRHNQKYRQKIKVYAFARNEEKIKKILGSQTDYIEYIFQDVCNEIPENIRSDYLIHTASPTTSKFLLENPVEVIENICIGTMNVLRYARNVQVKGMVNLSSMEAFGQTEVSEHRLSECELGYIDLMNVRNCYPESKRLCECLCKSYAQEYGVNVKTARLAQIFGAGVFPNENRVFAQFARSVVHGENIVLHTNGESMGNYCYTVDAIKAILLLLKKGEAGETYTVVNENSTMTIREMAHMVAEKFSDGKSLVVLDIPEGNQYGYAPETKMSLSSERLRKLGWIPEVSLTESYQRMLPSLIGEKK